MAPGATPDDQRLLLRLRQGDEAAFSELVNGLHGTLLRIARTFAKSQAVAEEIVQETWVGVIEGLDRFEGRSSLKTWIVSILTNRAKTRAAREGRTIPISALSADPTDPVVEPSRFDERGRWVTPPTPFTPEELLGDAELRRMIERAIDELPEAQRMVVTLCDIGDAEPEEVCNILGISETNRRVLLHRARSRVRSMLEKGLAARGTTR